MKKKILVALLAVVIVMIQVTALTAFAAESTYTVAVDSAITHGTVSSSAASASAGDTVTLTVVPEAGYSLASATLTVSDGTNEIEITPGANDTFTFTMPAANVTVTARFGIPSGEVYYANDKDNGLTTIFGIGELSAGLSWQGVLLSNVVIEEGVTAIANNAFRGLVSIESITIPASVVSIGGNAFQGCSSLTEMTYLGTSEPSIHATAFRGCDGLSSITVPANYTGTTFGDIAVVKSGASTPSLVASVTTTSGTTNYTDLVTAIAAAQSAEGSTVMLHSNVTLSDTLTITAGKFTVDLNGKKIESVYPIKLYDCDVTFVDDSDVPGEFGHYILAESGASLTVNGGKYLAVQKNQGNAKIYGGSFEYILVHSDYADGFDVVLAEDCYVYDENGNIIEVNDVEIVGVYYRVWKVSVNKGADLSKDAVITVKKAVYNGSAQEPEVTVTVNGVNLAQGTDFTVDYPSDYEFIDAGNHAIVVEGIGQYTGIANLTYTIEKATPGIHIDSAYLEKTYNLKEHTVVLELPVGLDKQYVTVSYWKGNSRLEGAPIDAGEYKVRVNVKGSPNHEDIDVEFKMTIRPANVTVEIMEINPEFFYNGGAHTPAVLVTLNGGLPFDPTEYGGIVDYTDNIEVGIAATATVSGNFKGSCTFEIKKATPTITVSAPLDKVMPGYVMEITGVTDAIDNFLYPTTFTVVDGEGYSVSGNTITIDDGVKIGSTITVKMISTETKNFVASEGTLTLTVGVPTVDTTELEKDIEELNKLIADGGDIDQINEKLTEITNRVKALEDNVATDAELETVKKELSGTISALETKLNEKIAELQGQINANDTDIDSINANITTINGLIDALEAADVALGGQLTDAIAKAENELKAAKDELKDLIGDVQTNLDNAKAELDKAIADLDAAMKQGDADLSAEIANLNTALTDAKAALEKADADNKAELVKKIEAADAKLNAAIKEVQKNLDDAKAELDKTIADLDAAMKQGDADLSAEIANLNTALTDAKTALEKADADNKAELVKKIEAADAKLNAAIKEVQKNLDDAKIALEKALKDGDKANADALAQAVSDLNAAIDAAEAAAVAADVSLKSELTAKIDSADAALNAAIDALAEELDNVKQALEKADADNKAALAEKDAELQTFIIIVCVISSVALCGSGVFVVWFFIDRKKRI